MVDPTTTRFAGVSYLAYANVIRFNARHPKAYALCAVPKRSVAGWVVWVECTQTGWCPRFGSITKGTVIYIHCLDYKDCVRLHSAGHLFDSQCGTHMRGYRYVPRPRLKASRRNK